MVWGEVAVRSGKLRISQTGASITDIGEMSEKVQALGVGNLEGMTITLKRAGTSQNRTYIVAAERGYIGELRLQPDFWRVTFLAPGDVIDMSFSVFIGDFAYPRQSQSFTRMDDKPLGKMKQAILDRLQFKDLAADKNGWVELCGDALRFEEDSHSGSGDW
jgi:hypothetical protein